MAARVGITYLYVLLYNGTGSVFLAMIFHALTNTFNAVVFSSIDGQMIFFIAWGIVLILQKVLGKEGFPGDPAG